jgi:hypothetical protein
MLVPLNLRYLSPTCDDGLLAYRELVSAATDTIAWPGATRSGFAVASYQDGPREL